MPKLVIDYPHKFYAWMLSVTKFYAWKLPVTNLFMLSKPGGDPEKKDHFVIEAIKDILDLHMPVLKNLNEVFMIEYGKLKVSKSKNLENVTYRTKKDV